MHPLKLFLVVLGFIINPVIGVLILLFVKIK